MAVEGAWRGLWLRPDAPPAAEAAWLAALERLPARPPPGPLTAAAVRRALAVLPLSRPPGVDDWVGEELRLWPEPLAEALAGLFTLVERAGVWPGGLSGAEVVLLPKPGASVLPITLLPVLYRPWGRLRGGAVETLAARLGPGCGRVPVGGGRSDLGAGLGRRRCPGAGGAGRRGGG